MKKLIVQITVLLLFSQPVAVTAQQTVGLFHADTASYGGYTLFAPIGGKVTYLVDGCGREVHRWTSGYNPGLSAYLLEDGSLLRACRIPGLPAPAGGGRVERRDWDNNLIWAYTYAGSNYRQHHDIRMLPSGNVLLLAHETKTKAECIARGRDPLLLTTNGLQMEYIVEVQPTGDSTGTIVWEWHLWDHLIQDFDSTLPGYGVVSDHPELLNINNSTTNAPDWVHTNAVAYNEELDQVIFNSRNQNEFWIIDHNTSTAEAAGHTGGAHGRGGDFLYRWGNPANYGRGTASDQQLWKQHDAHWIETGLPGAGQFMVFNNGDGRPAGDYSTVITFQPPVDASGDYTLAPGAAWGPAAPDWEYTATPPADFYSYYISGAQRLPDGNTHICSGATGRIFEVDSTGGIHWEYVVPLSSGAPITQGDSATFNATFRSYRYGADYPGLAGRDLTPGDPIEIDPLPPPVACEALHTDSYREERVSVFPNPVEDELMIRGTAGSTWQVVNMTGQRLLNGVITSDESVVVMDGLPSGLYMVEVVGGGVRRVFRMVKR